MVLKFPLELLTDYREQLAVLCETMLQHTGIHSTLARTVGKFMWALREVGSASPCLLEPHALRVHTLFIPCAYLVSSL